MHTLLRRVLITLAVLMGLTALIAGLAHFYPNSLAGRVWAFYLTLFHRHWNAGVVVNLNLAMLVLSLQLAVSNWRMRRAADILLSR
jgi:hypothetical protein